MVEVFKTNVESREHANMLIGRIHAIFPSYKANFDLEDCDKILRVKSETEHIESCQLISLLKECGFTAQVLEDDSWVALVVASKVF